MFAFVLSLKQGTSRERERKLVVAKTGFTAFFELLVRLIPGRGTAGGRKLDDDDAAATFIPSKRFFANLKKIKR